MATLVALSPTSVPTLPPAVATEEPREIDAGPAEATDPPFAAQPVAPSTPAGLESDAEDISSSTDPSPAPAETPDPTPGALVGALATQPEDGGSGIAEQVLPVGQTTHLLKEGAERFAEGSASAVVVLPGEGARLEQQPSGYIASGEFTSAVHESDFAFDDAVLSWGADAPPGTSLRFDLRVRGQDGWSGWYAMGEWGANGGRSIGGQRDNLARVDVDTLKLSAPATTLQYRVLMSTADPMASPLLRHVSVAYSDMSGGVTGPPLDRSPAAARDLPVPQHSQLEQDRSVASLICSATSLAMVMQYWGADVSVMETVRGVQDRATGIYGNWPLNTAFAESLGFEARVNRLYAIEQVEREIEVGRPVVISIAFNPGELAGAPISSTSGHLIVVRGFTEGGDVIVNDPIAPNSQSVRLVYKRDQLEKIWLRSGGIAYLLSPR